MKKLLIIIATCIPFISISFADFILNGNFDENLSEVPNHWEISYRDEPELGTATLEPGDTPAGVGFVRLTPLHSVSPRYLALQQKLNELPPPGRYKFKAWMRVSDDYAGKMPTVGMGLRFREEGTPDESSRPMGLSLDQSSTPTEWTLCENEVEIPEGVETFYIFLCAYGSTGHADFDGVSLEPLQN